MVEPIRLQLEVVLTVETIERIAELVKSSTSPGQKRHEDSPSAIYAGEKSPDDEPLLLSTREVAKLLRVSDRTLFRMHTEGEMPKPIRIGRAVRWGRDEIKAWVDNGCPPVSEWSWPQ